MGAPVDRFGASLILLASVMYLWHIAGSTKKAFERTKSLQLAWEKAQERQAAAEQANKAKSSFLANMSHEIRTPMNGILGMAEALEGGALTDEQRKQISIIRKSGDLLTNVLNDILDLSKIEANRIEIERAPFCLSELADRVQMLYASVAAEKGVSFEIVCEGDCHKRRLGDAHRISQVLHNLVSNAIKFTDEGSVLVRVRAPLEALPDAPVLFEVADTGIGISEEQAENIFEPFAQADSTTTRKYGGSGLGLTIAKGLVEAMGGAMSVRSKMGEGTRFAVELPLPTVKESGREGVKNTKKEAADGLRGLRLLAAEDNAVNREVLALFLRRCAHHVTFVENGLDAVAAFKDGKFDAILMDISMPVMDGQEAMRQVRFLERERGDGAGVPIIAVSAHAMRGQIEECLAAGFDGYVTKPLSFEKLQGELARVLDERSDNADAVSAA
jgi:signal transduction histidine kinase